MKRYEQVIVFIVALVATCIIGAVMAIGIVAFRRTAEWNRMLPDLQQCQQYSDNICWVEYENGEYNVYGRSRGEQYGD